MENPRHHQRTLQLLLLLHGFMVLGLLIPTAGIAFFYPSFWQVAGGIFIGGAGGVVLVLLISGSILRAVMKEAQDAQKYMLVQYFLRLLLILALLLLGIFVGKFLLAGIALGLFCVKIAGFLEPEWERRFFNK